MTNLLTKNYQTINLLPDSAKIMADSGRALREFGRACALNAPM